MKTDLKFCPRCGNKGLQLMDISGRAIIRCKKCMLSTPILANSYVAKDYWNSESFRNKYTNQYLVSEKLSKSDLEPCPSCGAEAAGFYNPLIKKYFVKCNKCELRTIDSDSLSEALDFWNSHNWNSSSLNKKEIFNDENYSPNFMNLSFNERLKFLRINKNLTQQEVADYLKIDKSTYAHYEKGDRHPDIDKLIKLAKLYNLTDEILGVYHE